MVPREARKRRRPLAILCTSVLSNLKVTFTIKKNYFTQNQDFYLTLNLCNMKSVGILTYSVAYKVENNDNRRESTVVILYS
jgi:hypothetical protein